ncbi:MAG: hypothetical protein LBT00_06220, partial [Spirochaetaceae bacterium]|nr:hypothetical protein [Spirochaetaceae bacterium]
MGKIFDPAFMLQSTQEILVALPVRACSKTLETQASAVIRSRALPASGVSGGILPRLFRNSMTESWDSGALRGSPYSPSRPASDFRAGAYSVLRPSVDAWGTPTKPTLAWVTMHRMVLS